MRSWLETTWLPNLEILNSPMTAERPQAASTAPPSPHRSLLTPRS